MTAKVLIIGAGPVGMTLASELARYGVCVRIVDKASCRTDKSKALVLWSRTLELLNRGGEGSAPFRAAGLEALRVSIMNGTDLIGRLDLTGVASPYPYALMIPQSETERLLEQRLDRQAVTVERGVEAVAIEWADEAARAKLRHADGTEEIASADWLVGCDGAHSIVRHSVGAQFTGETLPSDWVLADVHLSGYDNGTDITVFWHRDGVLVIFPIEPGRFRVVGDVSGTTGDRAPTPTLDEVQHLLDTRGTPGMRIGDPIWLSGFRINDRKVRDYRHGRIFLAGDAAHIHSPAGGQGMNTGMQDAFNLAWKLALAVDGVCDEGILDSYTPERGFVGDQVLKAAGRLTEVATLRNPVAQNVRNFVTHTVLGFPHIQHLAAGNVTETAVHYPQTPLNGAADGPSPKPGQRVPPMEGQPPVGAGARPRFALFAERSSATDELLHDFAHMLEPSLRPPLGEHGLWLVRPDGYVACAATHADAIKGYLHTLCRASEGTPSTADS